MNEQALKDLLEFANKGNCYGEKVTLVGATKTMDVDVINKAIGLGLSVVAENRVQEFNQKNTLLSPVSQHFIGHLQTNKVKYLVGKVDLIHSVDSVKLATVISEIAQKKQTVQQILVEVNVGGELSKSGFSLDNTTSAIEEISKLCNLKIKGLMAMLPKTDDEQLKVQLVKNMRALFDKLKTKYTDFEYLSMGMSEDYVIAVQNGANMIRIGSLIFGKRNYGEIKDGII